MAYVHKSRGTYDVCFSPCVAVREKAKQLVALLKDDRKLKEERAKAHTVRIGVALLGPTYQRIMSIESLK